MSKEEKFDLLYKKIVEEYNYSMELARDEAKIENRFNMVILAVIVAINVLINIGIYKLINTFSFEISGLLVTISTVVFTMIKRRGGKSKIEKYAKEFKENVIKMMIESFNGGFDFSPSERITNRSI